MSTPPLRIVCNEGWFEGQTFRGRVIQSTVVAPGSLRTILRTFLLARHCDAAVFNADERRLLVFCLLKRLIGTKRCRLVSVDVHLSPPRTWRARQRTRVVAWLLREVDLFLCYYKATQRLQEAFRLDPRRLAYVPFKVNDYASVRAVDPVDGGFALVCGRSDRDYKTLAAAAAGLDVPIVILTGPDHRELGVRVSGVAMPPNVTVRDDDGSADTWVKWISKARFVVLPVLPDVVKPSGISTYLVAMALGKCVIVTDSPATQGLIDGGEAIIVPAGDARALREAIARVASDAEYREGVAATGRAYALSLGDECRLADDIVRHVGTLIEGAARGAA